MTVTPDTDQLRRWAATHAATVPLSVKAQYGRMTAGAWAERPRVAGDNSPVRLTEIRKLVEWESPELGIWTIALGRRADDRITLATTAGVNGADGTLVLLWDAMTGQLLFTLDGHTEQVTSLAWGYRDDGHAVLATASSDGTARLWDPDTGDCLRIIPGTGQSGMFFSVAWRAGAGERLLLIIAKNDEGQIGVWDPDTGEVVLTFTADSVADSLAWAATPGKQDLLAVVVITSDDREVLEIWNPLTGRRLETFAADDPWATAWHQCPDGQFLLATSCDRGAVVRRFVEGRSDGAEEICPGRRARHVAWAPLTDGRALLAMTDSNGLSLWDTRTCERLHAESLDFMGAGQRHVDWALAPDGKLLLAAGSHGGAIHVWEVILDPPTGPRESPRHAQATGERAARGRLVLPPAEVTPEFPDAEAVNETTYAVEVVSTVDGRMLGASTGSAGAVHIWDLASGQHLRSIGGNTGDVERASWAEAPDGRLLLATADGNGRTTRIWDADTGQCLHSITGLGARVNSVAWTQTADGRLLLAITDVRRAWVWDAGTGQRLLVAEHDHIIQNMAWTQASDRRSLLATTDESSTEIWDADTGQHLHTLTGQDGWVIPLAWAEAPDGRSLLAAVDYSSAKIWDADTGQCLHTLAVSDHVIQADWAHSPDGRLLLATTDDTSAHIWDADTGELLHTIPGHGDPVVSATWAQAGNGRLLLAAAEGRTVWIWDLASGTEIASVTGSSDVINRGMQWRRDARGNLLLLLVNRAPRPGPARIWLMETAPEPLSPDGMGPQHTRLAAGSSGRLLRLGAGGLWPPLGLVADLVTLTGQADARADSGQNTIAALCNPHLVALANETGVTKLRDLADGEPRWTPDARAAFAALLASPLGIPDEYTPPADTSPAELLGALTGALTAHSPAASSTMDGSSGVHGQTPARTEAAAITPSWRTPTADLRAAAAAITDQVIALLAILGPDACAVDPLLPVRLAHHIPQLPTLSPRELRLLAAAAGPGPVNGAAAAGTMTWSPGTAGVARAGTLSRLLPTELALPRGLLSVRLAGNQVLYREHRAPAPPAPEPVTVILDTTPPAFGPAGNALRLAAHLITTTLWQWDRYPTLITLTDPRTSFEPRVPADLVRIWASATLSDPGARLATARQTAAACGWPVVCCSHHQTARDGGYLPGPGSRLLTSHQPPEKPPCDQAGPWHAHLPPNPTRAQLTTAIGQLLMGPSAWPG